MLFAYYILVLIGIKIFDLTEILGFEKDPEND
jgi:hypothetical protein